MRTQRMGKYCIEQKKIQKTNVHLINLLLRFTVKEEYIFFKLDTFLLEKGALFAQQIQLKVDLFARPIVMCTRYYRGQ